MQVSAPHPVRLHRFAVPVAIGSALWRGSLSPSRIVKSKVVTP